MLKREVVIFIFLFSMFNNHLTVALADEDIYVKKRREMVTEQILSRGISDKKVLAAMYKVERHLFVPPYLKDMAYNDTPLPIGYRQTISQPYIVAFMTEALGLKGSERILEIGTGSGYQAAILAEIVREVYTIEILKPLYEKAKKRLINLNYKNIRTKCGDGYSGWPEFAPFDAIMVTAAPPKIPEKLIEQLKVGGHVVIPVGSVFQNLYRITKTQTGIKKDSLIPVRFVPMVKGD
ncbi:MAG: protein-L-isoaspartate(D-aspartate) O-methyltransferase [Thermodesulfobacteriota bacterium]|nr:protein-L-isoaspartate(D-aspartate) O-methyltransferase [Thermodesulfobacteriota bacterium]